MQVLLDSHLTAAALQITDLDSVEDFTAEVTKVHTLESVADKIVTAFVQPFFFAPQPSMKDEVYIYSCDFLTHALLWYSFRDSVREGDGPTVLLMWKILMVIFK